MYNRSRHNRFTIQNERIEFRRTHPLQTVQRRHRLISFHPDDGHAGFELLHDRSEESRVPYAQNPEVSQLPDWKSFFSAKTLDQLIAEQGTLPVYDLSVFAGAIPDEDMDEFVADIYRTRT